VAKAGSSHIVAFGVYLGAVDAPSSDPSGPTWRAGTSRHDERAL